MEIAGSRGANCLLGKRGTIFVRRPESKLKDADIQQENDRLEGETMHVVRGRKATGWGKLENGCISIKSRVVSLFVFVNDYAPNGMRCRRWRRGSCPGSQQLSCHAPQERPRLEERALQAGGVSPGAPTIFSHGFKGVVGAFLRNEKQIVVVKVGVVQDDVEATAANKISQNLSREHEWVVDLGDHLRLARAKLDEIQRENDESPVWRKGIPRPAKKLPRIEEMVEAPNDDNVLHRSKVTERNVFEKPDGGGDALGNGEFGLALRRFDTVHLEIPYNFVDSSQNATVG